MIKLCVTPKLIHSPAEHLKSSHTDVLKNTAAGTQLRHFENGASDARGAASVVTDLLNVPTLRLCPRPQNAPPIRSHL